MEDWDLDRELAFLDAVRAAEESGMDLCEHTDQELRRQFVEHGRIISLPSRRAA
ncbi:MAG: hypothetical protein OWQ56_01570 [Acidithiobacillus caldus]|nr:hypothetical protein [Acidithiobacillus caldus]